MLSSLATGSGAASWAEARCGQPAISANATVDKLDLTTDIPKSPCATNTFSDYPLAVTLSTFFV
jgi:hypothetical protein